MVIAVCRIYLINVCGILRLPDMSCMHIENAHVEGESATLIDGGAVLSPICTVGHRCLRLCHQQVCSDGGIWVNGGEELSVLYRGPLACSGHRQTSWSPRALLAAGGAVWSSQNKFLANTGSRRFLSLFFIWTVPSVWISTWQSWENMANYIRVG